ncbi:uncharacterized protein LOC134339293 [Mobula hypostoma]|uniref:uncharacterized protein LOC134339293 n=1 Tax=Mobula hypostoma TaxID=723540 RepID=UPI002FC37E3B
MAWLTYMRLCEEISDDLVGLEVIRRSIELVESKLLSLITRFTGVEKRVDYPEVTDREQEVNPLASKADIDQLADKLEDIENRNLLNNLRFIGIPEGKEGQDITAFMDKVVSEPVGGQEEKVEIEHAHRALGPRPNTGDRPRPILARFLRSKDRDFVLRAVRVKVKFSWDNNHVMIFLDFSRPTQVKQGKFKECKDASGVECELCAALTSQAKNRDKGRFQVFCVPT